MLAVQTEIETPLKVIEPNLIPSSRCPGHYRPQQNHHYHHCCEASTKFQWPRFKKSRRDAQRVRRLNPVLYESTALPACPNPVIQPVEPVKIHQGRTLAIGYIGPRSSPIMDMDMRDERGETTLSKLEFFLNKKKEYTSFSDLFLVRFFTRSCVWRTKLTFWLPTKVKPNRVQGLKSSEEYNKHLLRSV